jgi:hypothetical protein
MATMMTPEFRPLSKKQRQAVLISQLDTERSSFLSHWDEIAQFIKPRRVRKGVHENNKGTKAYQKIVDSTATQALRTLSSGMMSGVTSPARPWFRLTTPDAEMNEQHDVREWLDLVTQRMRTAFLKSNLYQALPTYYSDLGGFSTACMAMMEDDEQVFRFYTYPLGSFWIGNDEKLRVRTFAREFRLSVRQTVERFGKMSEHGVLDAGDERVFSDRVRQAWRDGKFEDHVDIVHIITPNHDHNREKLESKYKRFASCYWEKGDNNNDRFLRESGFDEFPILASRWEVSGEDVYGTDGPGMMALGDVKQLQLGEKRGLQGLEKLVNPPMQAPSGMKTVRTSLLPGDITYVNSSNGDGMKPIHEVKLALQDLEYKQVQVRSRINRCFFADLFLMLSDNPDLDAAGRTATEIQERHEEKLLALGPVLEQLNQDLLDPLIERAFNIMLRRGMIPEPPEVLRGQPLKVEYISIMAQAQKLVGLSGLERFAQNIIAVAGVDPTVLDKVDRDELIDQFADSLGVPTKIIIADEVVQQIRAARAAESKKAQDAAIMAENAKTAQTLAATDTTKRSALSDLMAGAGTMPGMAPEPDENVYGGLLQ